MPPTTLRQSISLTTISHTRPTITPQRPSHTPQTASAPVPAQAQRSFSTTPTRPATLIRRPKRPYTFTQLIALSDGSTFTHRTTSPLAVYKSTKDVRNTPMWNPSNMKIVNVEEDEAGRLRAFRSRFGRGWDAQEDVVEEEEEEEENEGAGAGDVEGGETSKANVGSSEKKGREGKGDNLMDLIGGYSTEEEKKGNPAWENKDVRAPGKKGKR